jgi:hypothetical protein
VAGATPSVSLEVISTLRGSAGAAAINSKEPNTCLAAAGNGVGGGATLLPEDTVSITELPS